MKLILAIIPPDRLESVKASLATAEVYRLTLQDVQGFGRQKGRPEMFHGSDFQANLVRKVQLMIAVNDEFVEPTIDAIVEGGRSGEEGRIGDGKIFVLPLDECVRIRTGEHGPDAI
jgi:nitrogen regulatory protein P-II 2